MSDAWFDGYDGQTTEELLALEGRFRPAALGACDKDYYGNDEPIADRLFAWIKVNPVRVRVGGA